jgi:hypothetical protein
MSPVRDSFGTVVVTEFGSSFLAGVHSGDSSATRVMGCPLGDIVNFSGRALHSVEILHRPVAYSQHTASKNAPTFNGLSNTFYRVF